MRALSRSADSRAQVEPLAALAALFAVSVGLSLYGVVLVDAGHPTDRNLAEPTLDAVDDAVTAGAVTRPARLDQASDQAPTGARLNVTLSTETDRWTVGPAPSHPRVDRATKRVSVRLGPGRIRVGSLRVVVWR